MDGDEGRNGQGRGGKRPVGGKGQAGVLRHGKMVGPGGVGHVDGGVLADEARPGSKSRTRQDQPSSR